MESMRILKAEKSTGKSSFYLLISEASNKFDVMFGGYYFFAKDILFPFLALSRKVEYILRINQHEGYLKYN